MPLRNSELMLKELTTYLDELPREPCSDPPTSRYFCTICERLNKSVQSRCSIYKSRKELVGLMGKASELEPDEVFTPGLKKAGEEPVEFRVINGKDMNEPMPMFEIVKPSSEETEPLEMKLLEDEALEFELLKDDEDLTIGEDTLEVEPIEEPSGQDLEGIEVEPLEVEPVVEESPIPVPAGEQKELEIKPVTKRVVKKKAMVKRKPRVKVKAAEERQKGVQTGLTPAPVAFPVTPTIAPAPTSPSQHQVTPAPVQPAKAPVTTTLPRTKPVPVPGVTTGTKKIHVRKRVPKQPTTAPPTAAPKSNDDLIDDIEMQLIQASNCSICGAKLTNPNFCTQCGAKVVISADGVQTVAHK